jgi:chaperone required for assembly of F1-ATPase
LKRFWKEAAAIQAENGWGIALDGKPVRTPARNLLVVPTTALAEAIAAEWNDSGETVDPRSMPLTGLANAAIDRIAADKEVFAKGLAAYGESDLICYRAEGPRELLARQEAAWDELLAWGRRRFDVDFLTTCGIVHVAQPDATVRRLAHAVASLDAFQLAGISPLVTIGGSLLAGLAVLERHIPVEAAWALVTTDEQWQREQWGEDAEAEAALEARRRAFIAAARFLELLES